MNKKSDNQLTDEDFRDLLEYRVRFYENLANDALSVLNIQLFVLPVGLSIISIIISIFADSGTQNVVHRISEEYASQAGQLFDALSFAVAAVLLSIISYYISRRQAGKLPELALERGLPEQSNETIDQAMAKKVIKYSKIEDFNSVPLNSSPDERLVNKYNTIFTWKEIVRITLPASIILTFFSISEVFEAFFGDFLPVTQIRSAVLVAGAVIGIGLIGNFLYVYFAEGAVSSSIGILGVIVEIIDHYQTRFAVRILRRMRSLLGGKEELRGAFCLGVYFLGMYRYRRSLGNSASIGSIEYAIPILILLGLLGIVFLISAWMDLGTE